VAEFAVTSAEIACSFGDAPAALTTVPLGQPVQMGQQGAGTIQDFAPGACISTFGMCMSLANPEVAAATSAAMGALTPQPCLPVITEPWAPGASTVTINGQPALTASCTVMCDWEGEITISAPGQVTVSTNS
jgi:hypothetical protein